MSGEKVIASFDYLVAIFWVLMAKDVKEIKIGDLSNVQEVIYKLQQSQVFGKFFKSYDDFVVREKKESFKLEHDIAKMGYNDLFEKKVCSDGLYLVLLPDNIIMYYEEFIMKNIKREDKATIWLMADEFLRIL